MGYRLKKRLRVYPLWREDVFKDLARLSRRHRGAITEGSICTLSVNGRSKELIIRGLPEALSDGIMLDEYTRGVLGDLQEEMSYDFVIEQVGLFRQIKWACSVADRGYRISAWMAVVSVALGALGAILGILSLCISLR